MSTAMTRNLYRQDEIIAALRLAVARGRSSEAVFWVQEGLDSDMDVDILQTLFTSWLYLVGMNRLSWLGWLLSLVTGQVAITEENIIALTVSLVNSVGDTSIFALLAIGTEEVGESPPDHVAWTVLKNKIPGLSSHETTLVRAIEQGKFVLAWKLSLPLWKTGRAQAILEQMGSPQFPLSSLGPIYRDEFIWPLRALSLLIAKSTGCLHLVLEPFPVADRTNVANWAERKLLPMRQRRIYAVPPECLYSYTVRGSLRRDQSTHLDLTKNLQKFLCASPFWEQHEDAMKDNGEQRETFYETYFPNDIPDEWSVADRAKSHGPGVIPTMNCNDSVLLAASLRRFFGPPSKAIWGGLERAIAQLVRLQKNETALHQIYTDMDSSFEKVSAWDMRAMKKELDAIV